MSKTARKELSKLIEKQNGKCYLSMTHYLYGLIGTPVEIQKPNADEIHNSLTNPEEGRLTDQINRIQRQVWEKTFLAGRIMVVELDYISDEGKEAMTKVNTFKQGITAIGKEVSAYKPNKNVK